MDNQSVKYSLALSLIKGVGLNTFKKLVQLFGSAEGVFKKACNHIPNKYVNHKIINEITNKTYLERADTIIEEAQKQGINIITYNDDNYPTQLLNTHNPPIILYYKGNIDKLKNKKTISIVGTRKPTPYAKEIAHNLIENLKKYNVAIVSGLAYGIDILSHEIALQCNIPTYAILPSGINKIYPQIHSKIASNITSNGALITEYLPNVKAETHHFPARNRIIAGISELTIVIEASEKSGALITAEFANEYNREVFAVPGKITSSHSAGCNNLIKQHKAHLITDVEDIKYIMNWEETPYNSSLNEEGNKINKLIPQLNKEEKLIVQTLKINNDIHIDDIITQTNLGYNTICTVIMNLEINNIIQRISGNRFKLNTQ